jgi:hypothetical protein
VKTFIAILFAIASNFSLAQTYVQINGVSIHDKPGFNGFNYGAGVEHTVADRWTVAGGWFRNSEYRGSAYAYGRYAVYKKGAWDIGVGAGLVTGYQSYTIAPTLFPEVCYSYFCVVALPQVKTSGASALALHLRLPIN